MPTPRTKLRDVAIFLQGMSVGFKAAGDLENSNRINDASEELLAYSRRLCGQGFICNGGDKCDSDHK